MKNIRTLPMQSRLATFKPNTWDESTRTIEVSWGVGARVERTEFWSGERYYEELDMSPEAVDLTRLRSGAAPVLDSHNANGLRSQLGVVEDARVENGQGFARLRLSNRPEVAGIVGDIRDGIIRGVSVGYSASYKKTRADDGNWLYRAERWTPHELSFVTVPADPTAMARNETQGPTCTVEEQEMSETVKTATAEPAVEADNTRAQTAQATTIDHAARAAEIAETAAKHGFSERAAEWIRSNKSVDQVRGMILDQLAERDAKAGGNHNRVSAGEDQRDKTRAAVVNALMSRARAVDADTKQVVRQDGANEFRGLSLLDIARDSLARAGVDARGMDKMTLVGRAFTQSTSDFGTLLETTMHKTLLGAYATAPDTWSRFCSVGSVSDFRAHNRYSLGSIGNLSSLSELGEYENKPISDGEKASITAATKGNIINLSRQAIINDDLGAFVGLSAQLGRAARRTVEADVYAYLATNPTVKGSALFTDARKNLFASGSTAPRNTQTAPTVAATQLMRQAMASQLDVSGNDYLDLRPAVFVGSLGYATDMQVINEAQFDPTSGSTSTRPNVSRGMVRDIVGTPRITNNYWYLFADPSESPVIEVAFFDGQDAPFLDQEEGFTVDGTRWKVRLDFGIAAIDWRGVVRNNGA